MLLVSFWSVDTGKSREKVLLDDAGHGGRSGGAEIVLAVFLLSFRTVNALVSIVLFSYRISSL